MELLLKLLCNIMTDTQKVSIHLLIIFIPMKAEHMNPGFKTALTRAINDYARKEWAY